MAERNEMSFGVISLQPHTLAQLTAKGTVAVGTLAFATDGAGATGAVCVYTSAGWKKVDGGATGS